jgi:hypothetical protein
MEIGIGFWPSKVLLSAIGLGLFTELGKGVKTGAELRDALQLHPRSDPDFFDTLVALRFLERDGDGPEAKYRNTPESGAFLDRNSPTFMAGFLEMANDRLYRYWGDLDEALKTGQPQNEIKHTGAPMFAELYSKPERLEQFMDAMAGISVANFQAFAEKIRFLAIQDGDRRRRRHRTAFDVCRTAASAYEVYVNGPSRGDGHRRKENRTGRTD